MLDPGRRLGEQADVILFIGMRRRDHVHMVTNVDKRLRRSREFGAREFDRQRFMGRRDDLEQLDAVTQAVAHLHKRLFDRLARPSEFVGNSPEQEILIPLRSSASNRRTGRVLSTLISGVATIGNGKHNLAHHTDPFPRRAS